MHEAHLPLPLVLLLFVQSRDTPLRVRSIFPARSLDALAHLCHCLVLVGLLLSSQLLILIILALHIAAPRDGSIRSSDRWQSLPQPSQLEREPRADLLQLRRSWRFESVTMSPEEEEISLIV